MAEMSAELSLPEAAVCSIILFNFAIIVPEVLVPPVLLVAPILSIYPARVDVYLALFVFIVSILSPIASKVSC